MQGLLKARIAKTKGERKIRGLHFCVLCIVLGQAKSGDEKVECKFYLYGSQLIKEVFSFVFTLKFRFFSCHFSGEAAPLPHTCSCPPRRAPAWVRVCASGTGVWHCRTCRRRSYRISLPVFHHRRRRWPPPPPSALALL